MIGFSSPISEKNRPKTLLLKRLSIIAIISVYRQSTPVSYIPLLNTNERETADMASSARTGAECHWFNAVEKETARLRLLKDGSVQNGAGVKLDV